MISNAIYISRMTLLFAKVTILNQTEELKMNVIRRMQYIFVFSHSLLSQNVQNMQIIIVNSFDNKSNIKTNKNQIIKNKQIKSSQIITCEKYRKESHK